MNILKLQDDLKNFSQQQLVMEMQRPSGNVPQFLVLSELSRRKRMQTDQARAEAANTPTVAQEAVAAAGMPMGGVTQMAQAMAPKTSMTENTGIAAMMPKQPTRMAEGGVVKMQQGTVVYNGKTYFTDGTYVAEQGASGRIVPVDDPDIIEAVTKKSPSAKTDVGSLSNVSTNVEDFSPITLSNTTDPTVDRSALDPVLGIRPEMIPQFPDQGNPVFSSDRDTQKAISEIAGTRDLTPTRDNYRPFLQNQPQVKELLLPTAQPTGRQSLDGSMVSTVGPTAAEIDRAQKVLEMNPGVSASDEELEVLGKGLKRNTASQNFLKRNPEEDYNLFPPDPRTTYNLGPGSTAASGPAYIPPVESNPLLQGGNTKTPMPLMQQFRVQGGLDPIPYSDALLPPKLNEEKSASIQFQDNQPQDREPLLPTEETPELTPEQKALQKLDSKSAESTGALMDFYKDLEIDTKYETAMKMVEFGAELMKPTATIGEGVGNATQAMMKGAKERKKDYNKNKIAILTLQERIDASKAAAARAELGLGIQQANLDLRRQLGESRASAAELKRVQDVYDILNEGDRYARLSTQDKLTSAEAQELAVLQKYRDMLTGGVSSTISANVADA